ncbi:MAG: chromate transporter [Clostridia bacterium]|nr:chromate transporter [Clostridia bacterium]
MIFWKLFITFLEIGAVSFGGGYGMLSLIREKVLAHGWLAEEELLNMIAVSESTPGPIAVNMATFIGSSEGGVLGAFLATLGVVLPAFCIILLIAAVMRNFLKYEGVQAFLGGIRPTVVGLIVATGLTMLMSTLFGFSTLDGGFNVDIIGIIIFAIILAIAFVYKKIKNKKPSPIIMILISAALGMLFYGLESVL